LSGHEHGQRERRRLEWTTSVIVKQHLVDEHASAWRKTLESAAQKPRNRLGTPIVKYVRQPDGIVFSGPLIPEHICRIEINPIGETCGRDILPGNIAHVGQLQNGAADPRIFERQRYRKTPRATTDVEQTANTCETAIVCELRRCRQ
jgi:hypothetical protein